ncbi:DUF4293 domain-containing protein [Fluviicola sp.]|uniref:DUF4293 domain-containing protein n=1 Tax=Fluviicola sp. TaxID=1917219 RepID=UPI002827A3AA|nr:DUF4293 domain-containing protein [Fluviicola sp.]MDR0802931.1 DUF4293 domain-containing protein [Fluviicola sp.]
MIQRIQTIYFLIAAFLVSVTLFGTDVFSFVQGKVYHASAYGFFRGTESLMKMDFWMLSVIQIIFAFMIVFSFKMRHRQIFLGWILFLLNILSSAWMVLGANVKMIEVSKNLEVPKELSFGFAFYVHAAAFIFVFLGIRGVRKDKKTIDSLNRLR